MEKELSDKLINDWQLLMSGFKQIAKKVPSWKVEVTHDKHIKINKDWDIICYFINFDYIEVRLSFKDDEVMTLKHIKKYNNYTTTVNTVLDYIKRN